MALNLANISFPRKSKINFTAGNNLVLGTELLNFLSWENAFFDPTVYCKNGSGFCLHDEKRK